MRPAGPRPKSMLGSWFLVLGSGSWFRFSVLLPRPWVHRTQNQNEEPRTRNQEPSLRQELVPDDRSAFHHELHALEFVDARQRITGHRDHIGELALLERPYAILPSQRLRIGARGGLNRLRRRHTAFHERDEIERLCTVRIR